MTVIAIVFLTLSPAVTLIGAPIRKPAPTAGPSPQRRPMPYPR